MKTTTKTATIPAIRVSPQTRMQAEAALYQGESLSGFMEEALRQHILHRKTHNEFLARGLASAEEARRSNAYVPAEEVVRKLESRLRRAESRQKR